MIRSSAGRWDRSLLRSRQWLSSLRAHHPAHTPMRSLSPWLHTPRSCLILLHRQILHFLSLHMTEKQNVTAVTAPAGCNSTLFPFRRRFNLHISLPPSLPRRVSTLHTVTALACFISSSSCLQIQGGADE